MKSKNILVSALLLILTTASFAASPSFDCKKSSTNVEKLICSSSELSRWDASIAEDYKAVRDIDSSDALKQQQITWVKRVRNVCTDVACLKIAYEKRDQELSRQRTEAVEGQKTAQ